MKISVKKVVNKRFLATSIALFFLTPFVNAQDVDGSQEVEYSEKVPDSDIEPQDAKLTLNPEYKNKTDKISESDILDNEQLPVVIDEIANSDEKIETSEKELPDYKGKYEGSIRSATSTGPKKIEIADDVQQKREEVTEKIPEIVESKSDSRTTENIAIADELFNDSPENLNNDAKIDSKKSDDAIKIAEIESEKEIEGDEEDLENKIVPSRSVAMKNSQYLEVTYPGKGWSFIGDDAAKELMSFMGRKLSKEDTIFTLRSKKSGETMLHFYKNDTLTGLYIDDYLAVSVSEEIAKGSEKNKKVIAPEYAEYVPPKPNRDRKIVSSENEMNNAFSSIEGVTEKRDTKKATTQGTVSEQLATDNSVTSLMEEKIKTNIQTTKRTDSKQVQKTTQKTSNNSNTQKNTIAKVENKIESESAKENFTNVKNIITEEDNNIDMADTFNRAKKAFEDKNYEEALELAQKYLDVSTSDTDEVLYLLGQIWETDSETRNIKSSIDSYNAIVKNYPTSSLWRKANQRLVYLKRFYVDIR